MATLPQDVSPASEILDLDFGARERGGLDFVGDGDAE
jgi:hypothetical protein